ncbi:hypothetical protein VNO78_28010 [Psophocarpus tetragonolobus]|uniref:Uncharacterized protein n=1 Tax=Psophocarpus tetragonolobus TaxID=3891 RepID=A0AAN9S113_PSOTE
MLQWMGGSRRKVATKQYFEQRKRQQQNMQMTGSENCFDGPGISGQNLKEHRSLDVLNLLNLSTSSQQCNPFCPKGKHLRFFLRGSFLAGVCLQASKARFVKRSVPDHQNTAFNGPPSQGKTLTDQYSEFSVLDLLSDDEPNATAEKCPTCEDHVSFSLEGLGKVGTETPVHSPEQQARIPFSYSPWQKDGRKSKLKKLNLALNDIELEVDMYNTAFAKLLRTDELSDNLDTMMQDIKGSPICSSDFPFNKARRSLVIVGNEKHFYDNNKKSSSSFSEEYFYKTKNSDEDLWNACSDFLDENFDNEMGYNTSGKKIFQLGSKSPELSKSGAYKMENYAFEDLLPKKRSSAIAMKEIDTGEPQSSFSKDRLENDFDFYLASRARLDGNFKAQNSNPEDVRDNSSLLSEESTSCTAGRGESTARSPSGILTGENRRKHRNAFASSRNKRRSMPNSSKQIPSHYASSILQEELGDRSWQFEEINPSVAASFSLDLEAGFAVFESKNRIEDPFSIFTTPELSNKANLSFGGFKNAAPVADSPPCSFTSEKFAFDCSTTFPNIGSWPTSPSLSPDFQFKGKSENVGGFHCETSSTDMSVQGSVSKSKRQVKLQKDTHKNFEQQENIFMGDNELSMEKKIAEGAPSSKNHAHECEGTEDTNLMATECLVSADSSSHVEEISSLLKKPDKQESKVDKRKSNCDDEAPLKCKSTNEEMKLWLPQERNTTGGKHTKDKISLSGQVMFEGYVFQLLRVQKTRMDGNGFRRRELVKRTKEEGWDERAFMSCRLKELEIIDQQICKLYVYCGSLNL